MRFGPSAEEKLPAALPPLFAALRAGGVAGLESEAQRLAGLGAEDLAWTALLISAAANADAERVALLAAGPRPVGADLDYLVVWLVYWTLGPQAVDPAALAKATAGSLPPTWAANLDYLRARRRGARPAQAQALPAGPAEWRRDRLLPTIDAVVEGIPARLVVDTAAPTTVVDQGFAESNGLRAEAAHREVQDGSGVFATLRPTWATIDVMGTSWQAAPVDLLPLAGALDVEGIMSPFEFLRGRSVTLDGVRRELRADEPPPDALEAPLVWLEGRPFVRAQFVEGPTAWLLLDSGAGASFATPELANRLGFAAQAGPTRSATAFGVTSVFKGGETALRLAGSQYEPLRLLVKQAPRPREPSFPNLTEGYLGVDWFEGRLVWVSQDRRRLRFTPKREGVAS